MPKLGKRTAYFWALALALCLALTAPALSTGGLPAQAQSGVEIRVEVPAPAEVMVGCELTISIAVTATDLYGYQFVVTFDPAYLEAVEAGFDDTFLNPEYKPGGWAGTIDNVAGTVRFAATQQNPTPPASGSGVVAWVRFVGEAVSSETEIGLAEVKMGDADGMPLEPVDAYPGYLAILPFSGVEVVVPPPGEIMEDDGEITVLLVLTCEEGYGYQFVVTFDPDLLEALDADFDDSFLVPGYIPDGWSATIDNGAGTVRFAATQYDPDPPVSGTGTIGWITFVGKSPPTLPATAIVDIEDLRLASIDGMEIPSDSIPGTILILPQSVITGQVELQGRTNWSGAVVEAGPGGPSDTTDADGFYTIAVPTDTYTIMVEMERYLDAERVFVLVRGENTLPYLFLLGGDANDDDVVDVSDLSIIGGMYRKIVDPQTERADINADGVVDVGDYTLAGGNYRRVSPVPWP